MPEASEDDRQPLCPECHYTQLKIPIITFTAEDMLLKDNKHDRPLYYTGYIGSTCTERVQIDSGSALSIIPKRLLYFLEILLNRLSATTTIIYDFNAESSHPLGKIRLCCQIGDLKSEVTCQSSMLTHYTIYYLGGLEFTLIGSFPLLCTSASST